MNFNKFFETIKNVWLLLVVHTKASLFYFYEPDIFTELQINIVFILNSILLFTSSYFTKNELNYQRVEFLIEFYKLCVLKTLKLKDVEKYI